MAGQLYGFIQVFDANGEPLPGALLYTYEPNTTTPKATYTSGTLTTPLPNPVVADSAGRFPQMFADEGDIYDLELHTAADVFVEGYEDYTALGTTTGGIDIDFGLDGRFRVDGSGGQPNIEFGDPVGDAVGGDGRIGGWGGTQGDDLEIDFANVEFTGSVTAGGVLNPFPRLLTSGTATAAATTDIVLNQSFENWELRLTNLTSSTAAIVQLRVSFDGGATYKSTAGDYAYQGIGQSNAAAVNTAVATADHMRLSQGAVASTATGGAMFTVRINSRAAQETFAISNFASVIAGTVAESNSGQMSSSTNNKNFGKATNIRILGATGTLTFQYALTGIP